MSLKVNSRLALGRDANIGQLYDARSESLLETRIYDEESWPGVTVTEFETAKKCHLLYARDHPQFNIYEFFNLQPDQQASIVAGLQLATGSGAVLHEDVKPNTFNAFVKYSVRTETRHLKLSDPKLKDKIHENSATILANGATHLVCGIIYGADVVASYNGVWSQRECDSHALTLENVIDQFKEAVEKDDAANFIDNNLTDIECLKATMYSDVELEKEISNISLKESLMYFQEASDYLEFGNGRGIPITLLLLPLHNLIDLEGAKLQFYPVCKVALFKLFGFRSNLKIFDDFFNLVSKHGSLVMPDSVLREITTFRKGLTIDWRKKVDHFKKWLMERRVKDPNAEFSFVDSKFNVVRINTILQQFASEANALKWLNELSLNGIVYLKQERKLRENIQAYNEVYVLKFDSTFRKERKREFDVKYGYFLTLMKEVKERFQESQSKARDEDLASFVTMSNEATVNFIVFEKIEEQTNNFNSLFETDDEDTGSSSNTCVIERYQNGEFVGFCKPNQSGINEEDQSFATTVPYDDVDSSSTSSSSSSESESAPPSSCRWVIHFDEDYKNIKPTTSAVAKIICPGTLHGKCKATEVQIWTCENCVKPLEFDFDESFYCGCGVGPVTSCSFKCDSKTHRGDYYTFNRKECLKRLNQLKPREELNILVLGETGVGKSTFINAMANYLTFETMAEAEASDLISLIASSFTVTDKYYEEKTIQVGHDENEAEETGASKTQSCKCYSFPSINRIVRIVDTPGIGDTRGIKQDAKNFDNILQFISHYSSIHGILMLLKPNNSRLSIFFRFCIQELLCHLHKSASENIVFVFTNARSTFYRPGDTLPPLKKLLKEIKDKEPFVEIPLNHKRIYCLDNEAYRFLVALKNDVEFDEDYRENFSSSWERSVSECERLMKHIAGLQPHSVRDTISLNEARRLIVALSKPLGDITQNIQLNISMVQDQKAKIQRAGDDIVQLKKNLYVPVVNLEPVAFSYPRTVCAAPECYELHTIDGIQKIDYKQVCHDHCYLSNVTPELVNNPALKGCAAMGGRDNCRWCGCHYEKHMHIYYENKQVYTEKLDTSVQDEIDNKEKRQQSVQKVIDDLENRSLKLQEEQKIIMRTSAKFASFLKNNAITPYNDALKDYLEYLITVEEQKSIQDTERKALVDELTKMKQSYEAEVRVLEDSINLASTDGTIEQLHSVTINDIDKSVKELYALEINGDAIKKMVDVFEQGRAMEHTNYSEHVYQPARYNQTGSRRRRGQESFMGKAFNALQKLWL